MPMPPLPTSVGPSGGTELVGWRIDRAVHSPTWNSGIGAQSGGGRWNLKGVKAVYCSLDPAASMTEVAVHHGFKVLDTKPHVLTTVLVRRPELAYIVLPDDVPNPHWLTPGIPSFGQQEFGSVLLMRHGIILVPSAVTRYSWNLVFHPDVARGLYELRGQERFALDTRLHPPPA